MKKAVFSLILCSYALFSCGGEGGLSPIFYLDPATITQASSVLSQNSSTFSQAVLDEVNAYRAQTASINNVQRVQAQKDPLTYNTQLSSIASNHSFDIHQGRFLISLKGVTKVMIQQARPECVQENISYTYKLNGVDTTILLDGLCPHYSPTTKKNVVDASG